MKAIKKKRIIQYVLTLGLTLLIVFYLRNSWEEIGREVLNTSWQTIGILIFLSVGSFVMEGAVISVLAKKYVPCLGLGEGVRCAYYSCFYKVITFGSGSGVAEVYYLNKKGIDTPKAAGMSLVQYILHRLAVTVYGFTCYLILNRRINELAAGYGHYVFYGWIIGVGIAGFLLLISTSAYFSGKLFQIIRRLAPKKSKLETKLIYLENQIKSLQMEVKGLLKEKKLLKIFLIDIVKVTFWYLIPAAVFKGKYGINIEVSILLSALSIMLAGVIPVPAGFGSLEIVFILLFGQLCGSETAVSLMLLYRFAVTIVPFAIGGVESLLLRNREKMVRVFDRKYPN